MPLRRTPISAHALGLAAIITASVLWGASFFFGKIALQELAPTQLVLWRFTLAIGILGPLAFGQAARRRAPAGRPRLWSRPRLADVPLFVLNGLVMVPLQFVLQFEGLARTTASSAALLVGAFAPMLALAAVLVAGERLRRAAWGAVVCSAVGVVVMAGRPGPGRTLEGDLLVLGSLVMAVVMVLLTQRLLRRYEALPVTVWSMGIGTLLLLPWVVGRIGVGWPQSVAVWGAILGLGFGCTAATFSLWNWGLRYVPASHAGVYINIEPLIGAVLGLVFLNDVLTAGLAAGGALILTAAVLISWPTRRRAGGDGAAMTAQPPEPAAAVPPA